MDGYQFIAAIVGSLAWPAGAVGMTVLLRKPVVALLGRAKSAEGFGAKLTFGEQVEAVQVAIERTAVTTDVVALTAPKQDVEPVIGTGTGAKFSVVTGSPSRAFASSNTADELTEELSRTSAAGSIIVAWKDLESVLLQAGAAVGLNMLFGMSPGVIKQLSAKGVLPDSTVEPINRLRALRNDVAHARGSMPSLEDAQEYRVTAERLQWRVRDRVRELGIALTE